MRIFVDFRKKFHEKSDVIVVFRGGWGVMEIHWRSAPIYARTGKVKQKMMGVYVHWIGIYMLMATDAQTHGANLTIECIFYVLLHLQMRYGAGALPRKTCWQLDNCTDNKCLVVIGFAMWLLALGVFDEIELCFLLRGHTHEVRERS